MRALAAAAALAAALGASALAVEDAVHVEQPWARATPGGAKTGAAYLTLESREPDRLLGVETPVAGRAELHTHAMDAGVMKMRPVEGIALEPGRKAMLKPGGDHVMLFDLKQPLKEGQSFPLTLRFERAGKREVTVKIEKAGAGGPTSHGHGS